MKKRLTTQQEFDVMKLVLDKFLWLGFIIMAYGLYRMIVTAMNDGIYYIISGAVLLILFLVIIVKEYEVIR